MGREMPVLRLETRTGELGLGTGEKLKKRKTIPPRTCICGCAGVVIQGGSPCGLYAGVEESEHDCSGAHEASGCGGEQGRPHHSGL